MSSYAFPFHFLLSFFDSYGPHRDLHSFPTRRSSDLIIAMKQGSIIAHGKPEQIITEQLIHDVYGVRVKVKEDETRSEEHTSELQSRGHLVCRLLLEKKKKKDNTGATEEIEYKRASKL